MLEKEIIAKNLDKLFKESEVIDLRKEDKWVIFSDLHMGDGSRKDDFVGNSELFKYVLNRYYLRQDFQLILNGDIEELQRFSFESIFKRWEDIFKLFDEFQLRKSLYKIIGNHDYSLILKANKSSRYKHLHSLVLKNRNNYLFLFHGHQASLFYTKHNALIGFILKYLANPLGIKNYSVAYDSRKQFKIEKRVYDYSKERKLASLIGHTHRPLFESLSKRDELIFQIEKLIRGFFDDSPETKEENIVKLKAYKEELIRISKGKNRSLLHNSLYNEDIVVPCLFNSGTVIGNRGITSLEIVDEEVALVHYFDRRIKKGHWEREGVVPQRLDDSDYCRLVINKEHLDYIFAKIHFLS